MIGRGCAISWQNAGRPNIRYHRSWRFESPSTPALSGRTLQVLLDTSSWVVYFFNRGDEARLRAFLGAAFFHHYLPQRAGGLLSSQVDIIVQGMWHSHQRRSRFCPSLSRLASHGIIVVLGRAEAQSPFNEAQLLRYCNKGLKNNCSCDYRCSRHPMSCVMSSHRDICGQHSTREISDITSSPSRWRARKKTANGWYGQTLYRLVVSTYRIRHARIRLFRKCSVVGLPVVFLECVIDLKQAVVEVWKAFLYLRDAGRAEECC